LNLCDETITVFNAKYDADTDKDIYYPSVIVGVSWFCEIASTVDDGLKAADKYTIRIPIDADFCGKEYVDPLVWASLQHAPAETPDSETDDLETDDPEGEEDDPEEEAPAEEEPTQDPDFTELFFTLQNGDIIVKGDASGVANPKPAELQKSYPEMVTVLGVTDNRRAPNAKHWKVIGK